jgi:hypothetical protein
MIGKIMVWKTELAEPEHMRKWKAGKTKQFNCCVYTLIQRRVLRTVKKIYCIQVWLSSTVHNHPSIQLVWHKEIRSET